MGKLIKIFFYVIQRQRIEDKIYFRILRQDFRMITQSMTPILFYDQLNHHMDLINPNIWASRERKRISPTWFLFFSFQVACWKSPDWMRRWVWEIKTFLLKNCNGDFMLHIWSWSFLGQFIIDSEKIIILMRLIDFHHLFCHRP